MPAPIAIAEMMEPTVTNIFRDMCLTLFEDDCSVDPDVDGAVFDSPRSLGFFTCAPPRKSSSAVRVSIGGVSITQWAVGWIDITRRNMSTGARAMATTLEADGRRENGRWRYGAVVAEITDSGKSTWRNLLNQYRRIACAARPGGVPAAMTEAGLMADQDLARAKGVTIRASRRRVDDPLPVRRLYQLAQHSTEHMLRRRMRSATYPAGDPAAGAVLTA